MNRVKESRNMPSILSLMPTNYPQQSIPIEEITCGFVSASAVKHRYRKKEED